MKVSKSTVITRFPPSPTGLLHVGSVRTALFNYLYARQNKGSFILRIEDTDRERSKPEFEKDMIDGLKWLGLDHDNKKIVRQSEQGAIYEKYLKQLVDSGKAYISKEEIKEEGDRPEVIRFKNPNKIVTFSDIIRGDVTFDTTELGDFVIAKSMTEPLYHLAVVVDDHEAGVTHVIRGEDGISNTPRQILIQEAIGATRPVYAHLPLILDADRAKLSKRKHGEKVSLRYYRDNGFLKDAILNYMALLGWNPGTDEEMFTLDELILRFDLARVQKGGAIFNEIKLRSINKKYIEKLDEKTYLGYAKQFLPEKYHSPEHMFVNVSRIARERLSVFSELRDMAEKGELEYFFSRQSVPADKLMWKDEKEASVTKKHIAHTIELLSAVPDNDFAMAKIKEALWPYAEKEGKGNVLWPIRMALSGKDKSPDPFTLAGALGKEETLARLRIAHDAL
jgi:glutamyl-tRNA synthetase